MEVEVPPENCQILPFPSNSLKSLIPKEKNCNVRAYFIGQICIPTLKELNNEVISHPNFKEELKDDRLTHSKVNCDKRLLFSFEKALNFFINTV